MVHRIKVLFIGESWMVHIVEAKGFDTFTTDYYAVGIEYIQKALSGDNYEFIHLPCHLVERDFPKTQMELQSYDVVIISDVGANTFLLPVETFLQTKRTPNKLKMLQEYVINGGGLMMIGGYLSFMGIEGKGKYHGSYIEKVLPVDFLSHDDRMEHPEGIDIDIDVHAHEIFAGVPEKISGLLGYNRAKAKAGSTVLAEFEGDPIISLAKFGKGRSIAYATDCAPHWCSLEFCGTEGYNRLHQNMVKWLAKV
jgi:uncharacterized membrane protein